MGQQGARRACQQVCTLSNRCSGRTARLTSPLSARSASHSPTQARRDSSSAAAYEETLATSQPAEGTREEDAAWKPRFPHSLFLDTPPALSPTDELRSNQTGQSESRAKAARARTFRSTEKSRPAKRARSSTTTKHLATAASTMHPPFTYISPPTRTATLHHASSASLPTQMHLPSVPIPSTQSSWQPSFQSSAATAWQASAGRVNRLLARHWTAFQRQEQQAAQVAAPAPASPPARLPPPPPLKVRDLADTIRYDARPRLPGCPVVALVCDAAAISAIAAGSRSLPFQRARRVAKRLCLSSACSSQRCLDVQRLPCLGSEFSYISAQLERRWLSGFFAQLDRHVCALRRCSGAGKGDDIRLRAGQPCGTRASAIAFPPIVRIFNVRASSSYHGRARRWSNPFKTRGRRGGRSAGEAGEDGE